jgi:predicted helicase
MRENLLKTFDKIYILNLHGNSRKGENDENVFDIMVGVSIALFVKLEKPLKEKEVYYYSTLKNNFIKREDKTSFLLENNINNVKWTKLNPEKPYYWLVEKDLDLGTEYNINWSISKIFNDRLGVLSKRDKLAINIESKPLEKLKDDFTNLDLSTIRKKYNIKDTGDWKT